MMQRITQYSTIHQKIVLLLIFMLGYPGMFNQGFAGHPKDAEEPKKAQEKYPNILIITMDNVGYGDLAAYNDESTLLTPNIDRIASEGVRLSNFYTASPTCTASRAALLTGRIPQRNRLDYQLIGFAENYGYALRKSEILIPEVIKKSAGDYATGAFGKWNIGFAPGIRPTERGFDEFLGITAGNIDHFSHVYKGMVVLHHNIERINRDGEYSTDLFANSAVDFIRKSEAGSNPFFVYLAFDAPHHPIKWNVAPDEENIWKAPDYAFKPYNLSPGEKDPKKRFNAIVTAIDMAIGRVLNTLDSLGIAENTFVFLYSDNGAFYPYLKQDIQSNAPLRGAGVTLWEGGIRVPALARWPGKIKANSVIDERLWSLDLFIACSKLAKSEIPADRFIDGMDPLPLITGKTEKSPHASLYFEYGDFAALNWNNWKIIREGNEKPWQLYDLNKDISESTNLCEKHPDIVNKLSFVFDHKKVEIEHYLQMEDSIEENAR